MAEFASMTIEKDALSSVRESLQIGKHVLEKKLEAHQKKLARFEQRGKMSTETFLRLFHQGDLDDRKEWIQWEHVATVAALLTRKLRDFDVVNDNAETTRI